MAKTPSKKAPAKAKKAPSKKAPAKAKATKVIEEPVQPRVAETVPTTDVIDVIKEAVRLYFSPLVAAANFVVFKVKSLLRALKLLG